MTTLCSMVYVINPGDRDIAHSPALTGAEIDQIRTAREKMLHKCGVANGWVGEAPSSEDEPDLTLVGF